MTDETRPEDDGLLAAEYALGLLDGDDLADARRRLAAEPAFARAVTDWEIRLATMTDDLAPAVPGPAAKQAILDEVFGPDAAPASLWRRLWLWQGVALASVLALAFLVLVAPLSTPLQGPLYTAEIAAEAGDFRVVAVVDKTRNEIIMTRTEGAAPPGRILQVWAHGPGEPAQSVGLWPVGASVRLPMPPEIAAVEGVLTLGVSEEPPGGSTTGSPSGRVFGTVDIPGVTRDG